MLNIEEDTTIQLNNVMGDMHRVYARRYHCGYCAYYPNKCVLLVSVTQCNNVLLIGSIFTNKRSIRCLDIIEPKWLLKSYKRYVGEK